MKTKISFIILFLFVTSGFSQDTKTSIKDYINFSDLPARTRDTPSWANQFYDNPDQINIKILKDEINEWTIKEKKERKEKINNQFIQESDKEFENELKENISEIPIVRFALHFTSMIPSEWINKAGNLNLPTKNDFFKKSENANKIANTINQKSTLVNNWSQIGAKEIIQNGKQTVQNTNIYFLNIAPSDTNIRLACSDNGALFKTIDGGANWNYLNGYGGIGEEGGPSAFHPTDPNKIIYASKPARLSADGGATWTIVPLTENCNEILWSKNGTTIIATANNGLFVSLDSGLTFSQKITGYFMDVEFKPGSTSIVYAVNNQGVFYKSTDGGLTWIVKPTSYTINTNKKGFLIAVSDANPDLVSIASLTGQGFDLNNAFELIKSTNGGEGFASLSITNIDYSQDFYDFVFGISPNDINTYFVGVCNFFKSTDGGLTFNAIGGYAPPFKTHPDIQDMVIFGNTVVLSTDGGVSESTDNFTSLTNWKSTSKGLDTLDYWGFDLGFNTDQMGGGKYHNGNDIFNPNWNNGKSLFVGGAEEATGKAIFSRPNSIAYFGPAALFGLGNKFRLIDVEYNPIVTGAYSFTLENNLYYYGERNSETTTNTVNSNIIYAGLDNNVMISYDNGATSQVLKSFNSLVWDIKTTRKDAKVLYALTQTDGLWKTVDGGLNWTICNMTFNSVNLKPDGLNCFIDVSQTNINEIWLAHKTSDAAIKIFKSTDGGQVWTNLNTSILNGFAPKQIIHQYGTNGGIYLMGQVSGIAKCFYRNNTMVDWVDYSSNLMILTSRRNMFLKASHFKEKLRVAGQMGVQEISFYEKSNPVAQPTTNTNDICVNQEIKFSDYSILDYTGATWEWSFSKIPVYLNGTTGGSRDPIVKFLSPGSVNATLKVTNSSGISDTKTITNFVNVNYDAVSCLNLNSDYDYEVNCVNNIPSAPSIAVGNQRLVTNFNGATTGKFLVKLNLFTNCQNFTGSLNAIIDLDTDQISVIRYSHFDDGVLPISVTGNNTSTVFSASVRWAGISFSLSNNSLYLNHVSNYCASIGQTGKTVTLKSSCWKPYASSGIDNGDLSELQKCNNQIPQSASVSDNSDVLVTDFANATSGLFYVNINAFTSCNNTSNNLKAIINLDSDAIHVLEYKHFGATSTSNILANETSSITSSLTSNAQINYFISNNKLFLKRISETCNASNFRVNQSCWSAMDDDQNGVDNALQPSNCNNTLSSNTITDANTNLIKDFSALATTQAGVFVNLNINTSCNNTTATVSLSIDLDKNLIHVINYKHFGSMTISTVLNNDTPNVYSESALNGKLKFSLIDDKLYIQRLSTPCAGSSYQVTNSCYSLAADQVLAIENFISSNTPTIIAYPNPTDSSFNIDTKSINTDFNLSIYDINGKFITSEFEKTPDNMLQVDLTKNSEGLYFVVLFDKLNNKYNYLKIIKK